jgi:3-deoxy-D-manno-octulosonate 8-phosphate phosphatase (KDO 8-P phosphatase)
MELDIELEERAKRIKLLLMDCDGVLTDGRLYFSENGEELKVFHARDGQGIVAWHGAGFVSGIISGRASTIVDFRAEQLGIGFVRQGVKDKLAACKEIVAVAGVDIGETAYIGDDSPDIAVMRSVGFSIAVRDAVNEVKEAAHCITKKKGGRGAVREIIDLLLEAKK